MTWLMLFFLTGTVSVLLGIAHSHGVGYFALAGDLLLGFWGFLILEFFWLLLGDWLHSTHS